MSQIAEKERLTLFQLLLGIRRQKTLSHLGKEDCAVAGRMQARNYEKITFVTMTKSC